MGKVKLAEKIKSTFLTGIFVSAPIFLTILVFVYVFTVLDNLLGKLLYPFVHLPNGQKIPGVGLVALLVLILLSGILVRWYVGKQLITELERIFSRLPLLKLVYNSVKQVSEYFINKKKQIFKYVVFVPWPTEKTYMIGFVSEPKLEELPDDKIVPVFVPTTPNPTTGFVIFSKKKDIRITNISLDNALKMIFSAGMINIDEKEKKTMEEDGANI